MNTILSIVGYDVRAYYCSKVGHLNGEALLLIDKDGNERHRLDIDEIATVNAEITFVSHLDVRDGVEDKLLTLGLVHT